MCNAIHNTMVCLVFAVARRIRQFQESLAHSHKNAGGVRETAEARRSVQIFTTSCRRFVWRKNAQYGFRGESQIWSMLASSSWRRTQFINDLMKYTPDARWGLNILGVKFHLLLLCRQVHKAKMCKRSIKKSADPNAVHRKTKQKISMIVVMFINDFRFGS